jgi:hypothetical protein
MGQQGTYPIGARALAVTDTATGVVTAATADIPFSSMLNTGLGSSSPLSGFRNRVANPTFKIDNFSQFATAAPIATNETIFDRWKFGYVTAGAITAIAAQQASPPMPDVYACTFTVVTPQTLAAADGYYLKQGIDSANFNDALWGTANAKAVTVSFWVKGTVAGTYSFALSNTTGNRSYVTTYTVTTSWTQVVLTIPGDTAGTWSHSGTAGVRIIFDLGQGTTHTTASTNAWTTFTSITGFAASGSVVFAAQVATSTLSFSCIQLEVSPVATPFEQRGADVEVAMAQRFDYALNGVGAGYFPGYGVANNVNTVNIFIPTPFQYRSAGSGSGVVVSGAATDWVLYPPSGTPIVCTAVPVNSVLVTQGGITMTFTATGLLTAGTFYQPGSATTSAKLKLSVSPT